MVTSISIKLTHLSIILANTGTLTKKLEHMASQNSPNGFIYDSKLGTSTIYNGLVSINRHGG